MRNMHLLIMLYDPTKYGILWSFIFIEEWIFCVLKLVFLSLRVKVCGFAEWKRNCQGWHWTLILYVSFLWISLVLIHFSYFYSFVSLFQMHFPLEMMFSGVIIHNFYNCFLVIGYYSESTRGNLWVKVVDQVLFL